MRQWMWLGVPVATLLFLVYGLDLSGEFLLGAFIGATGGFFCAALLVCAGRDDELMSGDGEH